MDVEGCRNVIITVYSPSPPMGEGSGIPSRVGTTICVSQRLLSGRSMVTVTVGGGVLGDAFVFFAFCRRCCLFTAGHYPVSLRVPGGSFG